jgi:hypothetical protein
MRLPNAASHLNPAGRRASPSAPAPLRGRHDDAPRLRVSPLGRRREPLADRSSRLQGAATGRLPRRAPGLSHPGLVDSQARSAAVAASAPTPREPRQTLICVATREQGLATATPARAGLSARGRARSARGRLAAATDETSKPVKGGWLCARAAAHVEVTCEAFGDGKRRLRGRPHRVAAGDGCAVAGQEELDRCLRQPAEAAHVQVEVGLP